MLFGLQEKQHKETSSPRTIFIYQNGKSDQKPIEVPIFKKKNSFKDIAKILKFSHMRLFHSDGSQCFEDDLDFVKSKSVLYASRGEQFDPASCFAEYQMTKMLGQGGFGKVFLAKHKQTNEYFAIKIIKTENIGSVSDIDSIFIEAEILKSLSHVNIVKVHKCLTLKNMEVVIIMEYLEGGDLFKYVQAMKKLDQGTAKDLIRQIVRGMLYCHKNNLTHRDLKLQNVLLVNREQKKIKIIDFGIAGAISTLKWEDLDTGSLAYMAPQCFVNTKNQKIDGRLDVWSTGVILYGMLFGELPFKGSSAHQTIEAIKTGKYRLNPTVSMSLSPDCLSVLKRCLDVNPKTRITMQELDDHPWFCKLMKEHSDQIIEQKQFYPFDKDEFEKLKQISNKAKPSPVKKAVKLSPALSKVKFAQSAQKKRFR